MKHKQVFLISGIFIVIYLLASFFYLNFVVRPELLYFAQQPAFQLDNYFFNSYLSNPGGVNQYISLFITQFFSYNWAGALIITVTMLLFLFFGYEIEKDFSKPTNGLFWIFIPVAFLFSLFNNYLFSFITVLNILLVFAGIYVSGFFLKSSMPKWYSYFILAPIIYYLAGGMSFLVFTSSFLILLLNYSGIKKNVLPIAGILLSAIILPFLAHEFIFNITLSTAFFQFYIVDNLLVKGYDKSIFYYCFYFSGPVILVLLSLRSHSRMNKGISSQRIVNRKDDVEKNVNYSETKLYSRYSLALSIIVIIGLTVFFVYSTTSVHKRNIVKADYYCANEKWQKVIETVMSDKEYDIYFNFFYNRAIDNLDQYIDKYFDYPQLIGGSGTYPDELNSELLFIYYSDFYFDLGYISEAQQWAFKTLSAFPYNPRILKRLVITNLILGEYKIAGKFLSMLEDNWLSKDFVKQYAPYIQDTSKVLSNKMIMTKRSYMPVDLITPGVIKERCKDLLVSNKQNKRAYEHMQMNSLLNHQFGTFYQYLPMASNYYSKLPRVFEEALLIMRTKDSNDNYKISDETTRNFLGFSKIYRKYGDDLELAKSKLGDYKNTLFYYIIFDSPKVTKRVPVKAEGNDYNH